MAFNKIKENVYIALILKKNNAYNCKAPSENYTVKCR